MSSPAIPDVRRVLLAINTLEDRSDALEVAAEFAALLKTELSVLLVDDINLLRLAELPFAREMDRTSGALRPLDTARLTGTLESNAAKLRLRLDEESRRHRVTVSTRVVQGHFVAMARESAEAQDILVLSQSGQPYLTRVRVRAPGLAREPIWTYYDGSAGARRGLSLAMVLTGGTDRETVILSDRNFDNKSIQSEVARLTGDREWVGGCRVLATTDRAGIEDTLRSRGCAVLILPRELEEGDTEAGALGLIGGPRILA